MVYMRFIPDNQNYGQCIPGLEIDGKAAPYPVVNEREIRLVAGLMFTVGFATFFFVVFQRQLWLMNWVVPLFVVEFFLKAVFGPQYSLFGLIARPLVAPQKPEWVGAIQKRFAWSLGLGMALLMSVVFFGLGMRGWVPLSLCLLCLMLMWLEANAGICLGCKMYDAFLKKGWLPQPEFKPVCPGGVCELPQK